MGKQVAHPTAVCIRAIVEVVNDEKGYQTPIIRMPEEDSHRSYKMPLLIDRWLCLVFL
jgi:hypothetical protein